MTGDQDLMGIWGPLVCISLFIGMLLLHDIGRHLGVRRRTRDLEGSRLGMGPAESVTFALLGLLLAFTFSGAATRFDARRHLVIEEANLIDQAWLRVDLMPVADQPAMREFFRDYLDARIAVYAKLPDLEAAKTELERSRALQHTIWTSAVNVTRAATGSPFSANLLLASINSMIEITTTRRMAQQMHPPVIIYAMLFSAALLAAVLAGYNSAGGMTRPWLHAVGLAAVVSIALYVIIDIEHPRLGLVRVDSFDEVLHEVRDSMNEQLPK